MCSSTKTPLSARWALVRAYRTFHAREKLTKLTHYERKCRLLETLVDAGALGSARRLFDRLQFQHLIRPGYKLQQRAMTKPGDLEELRAYWMGEIMPNGFHPFELRRIA